MKVPINFSKLNTFDFSNFTNIVRWESPVHEYDADAFFYGAGNQHYQFLAAVANSCPLGTRILEIGTRLGMSALAIHKGNPGLHITTCDLEDNIPEGKSVKAFPESITFLVKDGYELLETEPWDIIFIDVDPHDGVQERRMILRLAEIGFKGILILDDIHLNEEMQSLWDWIPAKKVDLTSFGHYSGTGAVFFGDSEILNFEGNVNV